MRHDTGMHLGIDIRCLLEPQPTGISVAVGHLLRALSTHVPMDWRVTCYVGSKEAARRARTMYPWIATKGWQIVGSEQSNRLSNIRVIAGLQQPLDERYPEVDVWWLPSWMFVRFTVRANVVLTLHDVSFLDGHDFFSQKERLWHRLVRPRQLLAQASHVVAVSDFTQARLIDRGLCVAQQVSVAKLGSPLSTEVSDSLRAEVSEVAQRNPYLLQLGTLEPRKNIELSITAWQRLRERGHDIDLICVGRYTPQTKRAMLRLCASEHQAHLRILGYLDEQKKYQLIVGAKALLYPSWYEGYGLPPIEAMQLGTPVIAAATGALPEVLGDAALYIRPGHVEDMVAALGVVVTDATYVEQLRVRGKERSSGLSWSDAATTMIRVFTQVGSPLR